jgi:hypothetical protein
MSVIVMSDNSTIDEIGERPLTPEQEWSEMTIDQLLEQKNVLFDRWKFLVEHKYAYADDVKKGLDKIEAFIASR